MHFDIPKNFTSIGESDMFGEYGKNSIFSIFCDFINLTSIGTILILDIFMQDAGRFSEMKYHRHLLKKG
jgi:hypothetical protein